MRKYVLDTNLYIDAARDSGKAEQLASFTWTNLPFLYLHAVVVQEILSGAVGGKGRKEVYRGLIRPFEKRRRIIMPDFSAWRRSGEIVSEMIEAGMVAPGSFTRSFLNDVLIAASLQAVGIVLVTRNERDFRRIREFEPFEFTGPWPSTL